MKVLVVSSTTPSSSSEVFIVPNTGHGTFRGRPELVDLAVREFLAER